MPSPKKVSEVSSECGSQASRPKVTCPLATSQQFKKGLANCNQDINHLQGTRCQPGGELSNLPIYCTSSNLLSGLDSQVRHVPHGIDE